jgi:kumamolisin
LIAAALSACSGSGDNGLVGLDEGEGGTGGSQVAPGAGNLALTETRVSAEYWPKGADLGTADPSLRFRALIMFPIRDQAGLEQTLKDLYSVDSPQFRRYLSRGEWMQRFAPPVADVEAVQRWIEGNGMRVVRVAANRLFLQYEGTVAQWNEAFGTELHRVKRTATASEISYAPLTEMKVPQALVGRIRRLLLPDQALAGAALALDRAPISTTPPAVFGNKLSASQLARAYGYDELHSLGLRGSGMTIGVIASSSFRDSDSQSMWRSFGIERSNPTRFETMEPQEGAAVTPALGVQLAGLVAPESELLFYGGPDGSDTSLLFTFNEAVGAARAQILTGSFAQAESTSSAVVARAFDESAMMAAALGITVLAPAGDTGALSVPASSPYVTAVGGTGLVLSADGAVEDEVGWGSGCGASKYFAAPAWQKGLAESGRAVADVSVAQGPYWVKAEGQWTEAHGTTASSPVMAGIVALVNQYRKIHGLAALGYMNPLLYQDASMRGAFRDIVKAGAGGCAAGPGYDTASGIGSPKAMELATVTP